MIHQANEDRKPLRDVSVIIPAYNAERHILECVQSCFTQRCVLETIVVDDGSTDNTIEVLRPFREKLRVLKSARKGAPAARNLGLQESHGSFIKFLDADDVLLEGSIEAQRRKVSESPENEVDISYGFAIEINQSGERLGVRKSRPCGTKENPFAHILRNSPITSCPLHPKQALIEVGGFDESLPRGQEQDLHIRLVAAGHRFVFHEIPVYLYRQHNDGLNVSGGLLTRYGRDFPLQFVNRFEELALRTYGEPIACEIRLALAQMYWEVGRGVLREGAPEVAKRCFERSRRLHPRGVVGSSLYKLLARLANPMLVERWLQILKQAK